MLFHTFPPLLYNNFLSVSDIYTLLQAVCIAICHSATVKVEQRAFDLIGVFWCNDTCCLVIIALAEHKLDFTGPWDELYHEHQNEAIQQVVIRERSRILILHQRNQPVVGVIVDSRAFQHHSYISISENGAEPNKITNNKSSMFILSKVDGDLGWFYFTANYMTPNKAFLDLSLIICSYDCCS